MQSLLTLECEEVEKGERTLEAVRYKLEIMRCQVHVGTVQNGTVSFLTVFRRCVEIAHICSPRLSSCLISFGLKQSEESDGYKSGNVTTYLNAKKEWRAVSEKFLFVCLAV